MAFDKLMYIGIVILSKGGSLQIQEDSGALASLGKRGILSAPQAHLEHLKFVPQALLEGILFNYSMHTSSIPRAILNL